MEDDKRRLLEALQLKQQQQRRSKDDIHKASSKAPKFG
jgi:hypothetical protein